MLLVQTKVRPSKIEGLGLFADQFIPRGSVIMRFQPGFDQKFTAQELLTLPEKLQHFIAKYGWYSKKSGLYCMSNDDAKYFNHSDRNNVLSEYVDHEDEAIIVAQRNIKPGEELTDNYSSFEDPNDPNNLLFQLEQKDAPIFTWTAPQPAYATM